MADPGHGDVLQGQQGHHAAADVHEGPKPGQVGDSPPDHSPDRAAGEQVLQGHRLGPPSGETEPRPSAAVDVDAGDDEGRAVPHPGQHGDLPVRPADLRQHGLLPGDQAVVTAELHVESVPGVAAQDHALHYRALLHQFLQIGEGQGQRGQGGIAFGQKTFIFHGNTFLFLV